MCRLGVCSYARRLSRFFNSALKTLLSFRCGSGAISFFDLYSESTQSNMFGKDSDTLRAKTRRLMKYNYSLEWRSYQAAKESNIYTLKLKNQDNRYYLYILFLHEKDLFIYIFFRVCFPSVVHFHSFKYLPELTHFQVLV